MKIKLAHTITDTLNLYLATEEYRLNCSNTRFSDVVFRENGDKVVLTLKIVITDEEIPIEMVARGVIDTSDLKTYDTSIVQMVLQTINIDDKGVKKLGDFRRKFIEEFMDNKFSKYQRKQCVFPLLIKKVLTDRVETLCFYRE